MITITDRIRRFRELHQSGLLRHSQPCTWARSNSSRARVPRTAPPARFAGRSEAGTKASRSMRPGLSPMIASASKVPVNADFEGGFAIEPATSPGSRCGDGNRVAGSRSRLHGDASNPLSISTLAVERIRAAGKDRRHQAGHTSHRPIRSFIVGRPDLPKLSPAYRLMRRPGDCLYAPGIRARRDRGGGGGVAPKPVNVLEQRLYHVAELAEAGVRRISVGAPWPAPPGAVLEAARESRGRGTFGGLGRAVPHAEVNGSVD